MHGSPAAVQDFTDAPEDALDVELEHDGDTHAGHVMQSSAFTVAALNPPATALGAAAGGVGVALAARGRGHGRD